MICWNRGVTIAAAVFLALPLMAQKLPPAQAALKAAMDREIVDGDLKGAIALYQKLATTAAKSDRATAAKALLRLGQCYQTLGSTESRKTYERLVRDFADQTEQTAAARGKLATLVRNAPAGLRVRQLWTTPGLALADDASVSPDGRRLSYIDWRGGPDALMVAEMATGEKRRLTSRLKGEGAIENVISPDGKWVAYEWYTSGAPELRVVAIEGGEPRTIYKDARFDPFPAAWLPDGSALVVLLWGTDRKSVQTAVIPVAGGNARVVMTHPWRKGPAESAVSRDGRHLVFDAPSSPGAPERDIFRIGVDGTDETALVRHPADDIVLGWAPDGTILFRSNRSGSMGLWALPMPGNRPTGEPRQLKANVGSLRPLGFDHSGAFYYGESQGAGNEVFLGELDPITGKLVDALKMASPRHIGQKGVAAFSVDGKQLFYQSGPVREGATSATDLTVVTLDSGKETDLLTPMSRINGMYATRRGMVVNGFDQNGQPGSFWVDEQTGDIKPREEEPGRNGRLRLERGPGGRRLVDRDPKTGLETILAPVKPGTFSRRIGNYGTPDRQWLVWRESDDESGEVRLLSVIDGGVPVLLGSTKRPSDIAEFAPTPGNRHLLFIKSGIGDDEVFRVPATGGPAVATGIKAKRIRSIKMHPDGRRVAISSFDFQDSVWVMENWQAEARASR